MVDRKKNRSDHYQWVLLESPCSPEMLTEAADADSFSQLNPFSYNEELLDLKDQLKAAFWRIIENSLTDRQKEVIKLYSQGHTQTEIAKMLNVNQSSITKSINGNCDYRNGRKIYGGALKKIKKIADKDPEVLEILKKISELSSDQF